MGTRILVIDDEPQIRRALRAGLERNGFQVLLAAGGEEGLDAAAEHPPDLIVHLRSKIESDPTSPRYIQTEPRVGYRFRHVP